MSLSPAKQPGCSDWTTPNRKRASAKNEIQKSISQYLKPRQIINPANGYQLMDQPEIDTFNHYQALEGLNEEINTDTEEKNEKSAKPPPIFVSGIETLSVLTDLLEAVTKKDYLLKVISKDQIKILLKNSAQHGKIISLLKQNKIEYYTYQAKEKRSFRIVLKGIHHSVPTEDLKLEIETHGHKVRNIYNITHRATKKPLPLFYVDLEPDKSNNGKVYEIQHLQNSKCSFEPPHRKREIIQCQRCQRLGHSKKFCERKPRCVKCSGTHLTTDCKKSKETPAKCALCEGEHPANYKGCHVYKEIKKRKFSSSQLKVMPKRTDNCLQQNRTPYTINSDIADEEKFPSLRTRDPASNDIPQQRIISQINPDVSFAAATAIKPRSSDPKEETEPAIQHNFKNLQSIMAKLMERMDSMLNLLTTLVSRLPN